MCEGKAKLFQSETSYIELIALYVHPKTAIIFDYIQEPQWLLITVDQAWKTISCKTDQAKFFPSEMFTLQNLAKKSGGV